VPVPMGCAISHHAATRFARPKLIGFKESQSSYRERERHENHRNERSSKMD
jgi:hypothetical protein